MTYPKTVVKVDHVSKYFKLPTESTQSLRTALVNRFKGIKGYKEQHVLEDITFDVKEGDFFGILGRNGSGKSTLLKIISQIYVPEKGTVTVDGKLVSFIELGVGFNPELTGRENVYMNGAMLGFSTEQIDAMYDDIVEFAELRDFMNQKLKNYSSGMQVRLAFSVAIKAQGDILILDEVLAVGDEAFQRKCNEYFQERKNSGKTTILVTHDMAAVKKYCNRAVLIENGLVKAIGDPNDVANQYSFDNTEMIYEENVEEERAVDDSQLVTDVQVKLLSPERIRPDQDIEFELTYRLNEPVETFVALSFTELDRHVWVYNDNSMETPTTGKGLHKVRYKCRIPNVNDMKLKLELTIRDKDFQMIGFLPAHQSPIIFINRDDIDFQNKSEVDSATGLIQRNGSWMIEQ